MWFFWGFLFDQSKCPKEKYFTVITINVRTHQKLLVCLWFQIPPFFHISARGAKLPAINEDLNQTAPKEQSELGQHCLPAYICAFT